MSNPNNRPTQNKSSGFNPSDISFILMRHKWKIVLCTIIGLIGAAVYNLSILPDYISETKLLIRYVEEDGGPIEDGGRLATNGRGGGGVMNSEIQILTSMDLAMIVGEKIGPQKINQIGKTQLQQLINDTLSKGQITDIEPASDNKFESAAMIMNGMLVTPVNDSNVLSITFQHPNPLLSQPILDEIVSTYLERHLEAHKRNRDYEEFLTKEADQFRAKMQRTDQQIRNLYAKLNFSSIEDAKQWETSETSRLRQTILLSEAELAERETAIAQVTANQNAEVVAPAQNTLGANEPIDETIIEKHARILQRLQILRNREQELLLQYTSSNSFVRGVREQISITEREKLDLVREYPQLAQVEVAMTGDGAAFNLLNAQGEIAAIKTRVRVLKDQLVGIKEEADMVSDLTLSIEELEMKKELYVTNYQNYVRSIEEKRIEDALGESKVRNISIIQNATAPYTNTLLTKQITAGIAASGLVLGIAWAFLIELYLDRTFKRSVEVERGLGIPLFASIPNAYSRSYLRLSKTVGKESLRLTAANKAAALHAGSSSSEQQSGSLISTASAVSSKETATESDPAPWNENHALHPYFEALRDRMLGFFDSKNIIHTPKMIGLTGLGEATGVSTVSGGLAGALSNMGEGNVLLVDMNIGQESAHQFYQGKAVKPQEGAEEESDNTSTQIEKNLFVVAEGTNGYKLPRIDPKRFNDLVAKLKTSDYDYIVFDLPAVSPISATPRLARSMDAVMLVIESEKSDKNVVERATAILKESNEHVGAILNKTKIYAPGQLKQDFIGHS